MNIEEIKLYITIFTPVLTIFLALVMGLKRIVKNKTLKRVLTSTESITKRIIPYIMEAEKCLHYTGAEKKSFVLMRLGQLALKLGVKLPEDELSKRIDELITFTNEVNVGKEKNTSVEPVVLETIEEEKSLEPVVSELKDERIKSMIERMRKE